MKTVCSRPEYGLRYGPGVQAPFTHSCNNSQVSLSTSGGFTAIVLIQDLRCVYVSLPGNNIKRSCNKSHSDPGLSVSTDKFSRHTIFINEIHQQENIYFGSKNSCCYIWSRIQIDLISELSLDSAAVVVFLHRGTLAVLSALREILLSLL